jgi:indolepyruvate ferredoxin oxidoreductase beta subunit
MSERNPINILIAGVGGQGNLLASRLLAGAASSKGFCITIGETKGASQRSGSVSSHVRLSDVSLGPLIPQKSAHIILGFEPMETLRFSRKYSNTKTIVLVNDAPVVPMLVAQGMQEYPKMDAIISELQSLNESVIVVNATNLANDMGAPVVMNVIMLGALCALEVLPFGKGEFIDAITARVPERHRGLNLMAFEAGYEEGLKQAGICLKEGEHA